MSPINLTTYEKAKREIKDLQNYITLIDNYKVNNLEQFIIKNYALTNSSSSVIKNFNKNNPGFPPISREYILKVIKGPPIDELHRILRKGYIKKYKK